MRDLTIDDLVEPELTGDPRAHATRPPVVLCYRDGTLRDDVPLDAVDGQVAKSGGLVWLDVEHPDEDKLNRLQEELQLHPLVIQDLRFPHQRPKVDEYPGLTMVVLFAARLTRRMRLHLSEVAIFVGPRYIVTVHRDPVPSLNVVRERWKANPSLVEPHPQELLLYRICEAIVAAYFPLVDVIEDRIARIEERLFSRFDRTLLRELLTLRRDLTELRRIVAPPRDVFTTLARHDDPNVGGFTAPYFTDLVDLVLRLTDTIDVMRDRLGTALESYLTLQSNALNETVKRLTGVTVILTLPMIVSSVYGMNFHEMPLLDWYWGFWAAVVLTAALMVGATWLLRRLGWL
jgi:magnesium transporter